ncbi:fungal immunomodulatory protein [Trametopsis cervina]|nr:fungal immunomodulatory protein [Trametopsis cervina]
MLRQQYPPSARQTVADSRARGDTVVGETRPPLLVKVTGYRLLNTSILLGLGIWKTVASYRNEAILSTSLDLLLGVILAAILYWLGLFEAVQPPRLRWLFEYDYATLLRKFRRPRAHPVNTLSAPERRNEPDRSRRSPPIARRSPPPRQRGESPRSLSTDRPPPTSFRFYDGELRWIRGNPPWSNYLDGVVFPNVRQDESYTFRLQKGNVDLGTQPSYAVDEDGSQKVNFLEYNAGYGIRDDTRIQVYARDPRSEGERLVAQWR